MASFPAPLTSCRTATPDAGSRRFSIRFWQPVFSFPHDYLRTFGNVTVHPTQQMFHPPGVLFRGGPEWPRFAYQILARHCWGALPRPVDARPFPAQPEWPYFDPRLYVDPSGLSPEMTATLNQLLDAQQRSERPSAEADTGLWCGPITGHFGHMVADFGMRIASSSRVDETTPLVFSLWPLPDAEPPAFFWELLDHLQVDRSRIMLIRAPTRFARLSVLPQAERRDGGRPSRRHLAMMDAIAGRALPPPDSESSTLFVSRARLPKGRFAAEAYLDQALAAAGVAVFHPETVDLATQLQLYRRTRRLIFSEGSALHALQLLGHIDADVVVLTRRPRQRLAESSLRPRVRSLRYLNAARAVIPALRSDGQPHPPGGISVFDEAHLLDAMDSLCIELRRRWDPTLYTTCRDRDIEAWMADRVASPAHPDEPVAIAERWRALSLR
jgi:Glycosyltransferase 61